MGVLREQERTARVRWAAAGVQAAVQGPGLCGRTPGSGRGWSAPRFGAEVPGVPSDLLSGSESLSEEVRRVSVWQALGRRRSGLRGRLRASVAIGGI